MKKTLTVDLLALCDFALVSQEGKLSLVGMFDRMFVSQLPTTYARFFIVMAVSGKPRSNETVMLRLKAPSGTLVLPEKELTFAIGEGGTANMITDVINLPLTEVGEHSLSLVSGKQTLVTKPLTVMKVAEPGGSYKLPN